MIWHLTAPELGSAATWKASTASSSENRCCRRSRTRKVNVVLFPLDEQKDGGGWTYSDERLEVDQACAD